MSQIALATDSGKITSLWADDAQPTLAAIDAVSGDQPVALSSAYFAFLQL